MTDGNGTAPEPILAGHLVIYEDMIAFRPDGGTDEQVIRRPIKGKIGMGGVGALVAFLSPGDGGQMAMLIGSGMDSMNPMAAMKAIGANRAQRRAVAAQMGGVADE